MLWLCISLLLCSLNVCMYVYIYTVYTYSNSSSKVTQVLQCKNQGIRDITTSGPTWRRSLLRQRTRVTSCGAEGTLHANTPKNCCWIQIWCSNARNQHITQRNETLAKLILADTQVTNNTTPFFWMLWVSCTCVQGSRKWDCSKQESWAYVFQTLFTWQVDDGSSSEFEESWLLPAAEELNLLASDRKLGPLGWFTGVQCNNQAGPTQGNTLPPANGNIFVGNSKALCQKRMPAALCNTRPSWRAEHDIDHWREAGPDGSNIATFMASTSHASHATSLPQGHSASFAPASNINGTGGHLKEMQIERMEKEWCHFLCDLKSSRFASNETNKYKQLSPLESGGTERLLTMIWAVNNFHSLGSPPVCCRRKWPPQRTKTISVDFRICQENLNCLFP